MLKQVPGGPSVAEAKQFSTPPVGAGVSYKYITSNLPSESQTNEYPVVPFAPDSYDTIASIKASVGSNANNAFGQKWMVPFTDSDAQYLLRQQAQAQNVNYERWLWQQYDLEDPAQAWIFQQIAPDQFEKRKQLILYQQNLATKYAMLRLYGCKNQEDLMLKYLVETKQVELPQGPIWAPQEWMAKQMGYATVDEYKKRGFTRWKTRYAAGMFNPMKYQNEDSVGYESRHKQDPFDHRPDNLEGQIFAGTSAWKQPYNDYGNMAVNSFSQMYDAKNYGTGLND